MNITPEMVKAWARDGLASALEEVDQDAPQIAAQMTAEINNNTSHTSKNTIRMSLNIALDGNSRQATIIGGYGFSTPNLGDEAPPIVREIPNPDQGELDLDGKPGATNPKQKAVDATTPKPEEQ